jgi:SPP1 family predicted phage head-tail adaptor
MRAGRLRHLYQIEEKLRKSDGQGGFSPVWFPVCSVYGRLKKITANTETEAGQRQAVKAVVFETRFNLRIRPDMRLNHGGDYYEITGVFDPSGRGERLEITAEIKNYD